MPLKYLYNLCLIAFRRNTLFQQRTGALYVARANRLAEVARLGSKSGHKRQQTKREPHT